MGKNQSDERPTRRKLGYIDKFEKAYDGFGLYRVKVRLTSDSAGNPLPRKPIDTTEGTIYVPFDATFYDHEIELLPDLEMKREDLINLSLDIESEPLFRLLVAEG